MAPLLTPPRLPPGSFLGTELGFLGLGRLAKWSTSSGV